VIDINNPKIDKNMLKQEIENIIENYKRKPKTRRKTDKKNFKLDKEHIYIIEDFTKYHDVEFIENIYSIVLQREVDDKALSQRLELLRTGKRSKSEILAMIRFSEEGRRVNIPILGIKKRYIMAILYKIPILGFFSKLFLLPRFFERLNRFEAHYFIYQNELNQKISTKVENIKFEKNIEYTSKSTQHNTSAIQELEFRIREINRAKESLKEIENNLNTLINNIKENTLNENKSIIINRLEDEIQHSLDSLYISFEDKFRGSRENIKNRQKYYLPIIKDILKEINGDLIDIGCGRGEWLELLKNNSIKAIGVDLNRLMVKESKKYNLDAIFDDAIIYLKNQKDNSIAIITGFHIVEHLPFESLISLLDESYRVLKNGGIIIFETPNPENIMVGACNFYTDPTHINPIPPVTLEFLAQNRGFKNIEIHRLHPVKKPSFVDLKNNEDINDLILASTKAQDYSIVGHKI
jgi:O-antigen chain-terminating methyltransferase